MSVKYYRDESGNYIGAFSGSIPEGGIEVAAAPSSASAAWNGEGWDEPVVTPQSVSRAQGTAQLQLSGYWDTVVALVEAIPDPSAKIVAKQALYSANTWQKNSPTMQLLAGEDGLNLTQQQFDNLFINANQIQL